MSAVASGEGGLRFDENKHRALDRLTKGPIKVCACGRSYTLAEYLKLPPAGWWNVGGTRNEMRHCKCKSTLMFRWRKL